MSYRRNIKILSSILFLAVILYGTNETLASVVSEELSTHGVVDYAVTAVQQLVDSSSVEADVEMTTDLTAPGFTTTTTTTWIESENRHIQEPKLPVDLLSEDILLDPNVVLARIARNLDTLEYPYRRRPLRRSEQTSNYYDQPNKKRNYVSYNLPIYPVFPGKK